MYKNKQEKRSGFVWRVGWRSHEKNGCIQIVSETVINSHLWRHSRPGWKCFPSLWVQFFVVQTKKQIFQRNTRRIDASIKLIAFKRVLRPYSILKSLIIEINKSLIYLFSQPNKLLLRLLSASMCKSESMWFPRLPRSAVEINLFRSGTSAIFQDISLCNVN